MAEAEATALFKIKADASQAVKETIRLAEAQKKLAYEVEKSAGGWQKTIDGLAIVFAKFNLAMGGVQTAFGLFKQALDVTDEINNLHRLEKALPTGALNRLMDAQEGMISQTKVLQLATKGMTGDFKLTEEQMGKVLRAAVAYEQQGLMPADEAAEKLLDSTQRLKEKGLAELGIEFDKTGNRIRDTEQIMEKLDERIENAGPIDARAAALDDLGDKFEELGLAIKETIAMAVNGVASLVASIGKLDEATNGALGDIWDFAKKAGRLGGSAMEQDVSHLFTSGSLSGSRWGRRLQGMMEPTVSFPGRGTPMGPAMERDDLMNAEEERRKAREEERRRAITGVNYRGYAVGEREVEAFSPVGEGGFGGAIPTEAELSSLEGVGQGYGPNESFAVSDKLSALKNQLGDTNTAAGASFATLSAGITAAVDAAISGSDSIGKAAAKASAAVLKSLAIESTGRAVYEGALALGSLAIGDAKGAGLHGLAAAKFALAAATTGALAAGLGAAAGGSGSGAGAGASAGAPGGGFASGGARGGGSGGGDTVIVNIGGGFVSGDPNKIAEAVANAVRQAKRKGARESFATNFSG